MNQTAIAQIKRILMAVFLSIGAALLIAAGVVFYQLSQVKNIFVPITAEVLDFSNSSDTKVKYKWENESYENYINFFDSFYREGEEIEVYINPENPDEVEVTMGYWIGIAVPGGIGLSFFLVALLILFIPKHIKNKQEKLRQKGRKIYAQIDDVLINYTYNMNGHHPYQVICKWKNPEDGITYYFRSPNLWENPSLQMEEKNITVLPVYFNEKHIKTYFVDTDSLINQSEKNVYL